MSIQYIFSIAGVFAVGSNDQSLGSRLPPNGPGQPLGPSHPHDAAPDGKVVAILADGLGGAVWRQVAARLLFPVLRDRRLAIAVSTRIQWWEPS